MATQCLCMACGDYCECLENVNHCKGFPTYQNLKKGLKFKICFTCEKSAELNGFSIVAEGDNP